MPVDIVRNSSVTVGASNTTISRELVPNSKRVLLSITNTSTGGQSVAIVWGQDAPNATTGMVLYPGTTFIDSADSGYFPSPLKVQGYASGAGATVAIFERVVV